jgi:hypothetical protein
MLSCVLPSGSASSSSSHMQQGLQLPLSMAQLTEEVADLRMQLQTAHGDKAAFEDKHIRQMIEVAPCKRTDLITRDAASYTVMRMCARQAANHPHKHQMIQQVWYNNNALIHNVNNKALQLN